MILKIVYIKIPEKINYFNLHNKNHKEFPMSVPSLTCRLEFSSTFENTTYIPVIGAGASLITLFRACCDLYQGDNLKLTNKEYLSLTAYSILNMLSLGTLGTCFGIAKVVSSLYHKCMSSLEPTNTLVIYSNEVRDLPTDKPNAKEILAQRKALKTIQKAFRKSLNPTITIPRLFELTNDKTDANKLNIRNLLQRNVQITNGKRAVKLANTQHYANLIIKTYPLLLNKFPKEIQERYSQSVLST